MSIKASIVSRISLYSVKIKFVVENTTSWETFELILSLENIRQLCHCTAGYKYRFVISDCTGVEFDVVGSVVDVTTYEVNKYQHVFEVTTASFRDLMEDIHYQLLEKIRVSFVTVNMMRRGRFKLLHEDWESVDHLIGKLKLNESFDYYMKASGVWISVSRTARLIQIKPANSESIFVAREELESALLSAKEDMLRS